MTIIEDKNNLVKIKLEEIDNHTIIIHLKGTVDTYNSPYFIRQIDKIINNGFIKIILDFRELIYMSSTGVGAIVTIFKVLKAKKGILVILDMMPKVYEVFQLLGMSAFLTFADSKDQAFELLREKEVIATFPFTFKCPLCKKKLRATKHGRFKCLCDSILIIDISGTVMLG